MADRMVIYDAALEVAAVIDTDSMRALGPVGVGPNAQGELTQFVERMPGAVWNLSTYDLATAYMEFWHDNFAALYEPTPDSASDQVVESNGAGSDEDRQAAAEATAAGAEPPPPQPADADMEADAGETAAMNGEVEPAHETELGPGTEPAMVEGVCFVCNGSGRVPGATGETPAVCNMCQGTGRTMVPA